ncbi:MAG: dihydrolipoyl dehydrogenase, partial [Paracoccaceae bacterium]
MDFDYDLFVIGGGSGGVRAARMAAQAGARVAIAEDYRFGGTCVIRGCIPKKLLVYASQFAEAFEDAEGYGWTVGERTHSWDRLREAKEREITRLQGLYHRNVSAAGAEVFEARATLRDPHTVALADGREVSAKYVLVATGGHPRVPEFPGHELAITSDDIFDLEEFPRRIAILGGGYIACEFAFIMNGLGAEVTLAYRGERILRTFDYDLSDHAMEAMREKGIDLRLHADIGSVERTDGGLRVSLGDGSDATVDCVLAATGRQPSTGGLGLEEIGVRLRKNGAVEVDAYSRSSLPNVYAIGDVAGQPMLAHKGSKEGLVAAGVIAGKPEEYDVRCVPAVIFTSPEMASVGLLEEQAEEQGHEVATGQFPFAASGRAMSLLETEGFVKVVSDARTDEVRGVHMVGPEVTELIAEAALAIEMGATTEDVARTIHAHPTL